jgi:hypothetical protein
MNKTLNKIKKFIMNNIIGFIMGGIIFGSVGVYAATIASSAVSYDNSNSQLEATNVQEALDELNTMATEAIDQATKIVDLGVGTSFNVTQYSGYKNFTRSNFIIEPSSKYNITPDHGTNNLEYYVNASNPGSIWTVYAFKFSPSYNASTGVLTTNMFYYLMASTTDWATSKLNRTFTLQCHVYLVY